MRKTLGDRPNTHEASPPTSVNTASVNTAFGYSVKPNNPEPQIVYPVCSEPNQRAALVQGRTFQCDRCNRSYKAKPALARHQKDCGVRDTSKCQFCDARYPTFPGVRQHERLAHPVLYKQESEAKLPEAESTLLENIALVEAKTTKAAGFYKDMVAATGLTQHQIRYRREKPVYKLYLEKARKELAREIGQKNPPSQVTRDGAIRTASSKTPCRENSAATKPKTVLPLVKSIAEDLTKAEGSGARPRPNTRPGKPQSVQKPESVRAAKNVSEPSNTEVPPPPRQTRKRLEVEASRCPRGTGAGSPSGNDRNNAEQSPNVSRRIPRSTNQRNKNTARATTTTRQRLSQSLQQSEQAESHGSEAIELESEAISLHLKQCLVSLPKEETALVALVRAALNEPQERLIELVDDWLVATMQGQPRNKRHQRKNRRCDADSKIPSEGRDAVVKTAHHYGQVKTGSSLRAARFKRAQDLYCKNRSGLAEAILEGRPLDSNKALDVPRQKDVEDLYGGILESPSPADDSPFSPKPGNQGNVLQPITQNDVRAAKINWRQSAQGPDKISVGCVKLVSEEKLSILYNVLLLRNVQPTSWTRTNTTLIPKGGDLKNAENWRPITIGSAVQRLFHRILVKRLKAHVDLSTHQRGFVNIDGTLGNSLILDQYILDRTIKGKAYQVVSLDIRKAFDTVSHHSISRSMRRFRVHKILRQYIMSTFTSTTTIKVGEGQTRPLKILRGVRQGDPLSPLLFNMVMDELLESLNSNFSGGSLPNGAKCAAMAFADDIIMLSDHEVEVPLMLRTVEEFLRERGMSVNPAKCRTLVTGVVAGRTVPRTKRSTYKINNSPIPVVTIADTFKYLGHGFGYSGVGKPSLRNLTVWLENLGRAPLKPDQKLTMVKTYVIPRLLYGFQNPKVTTKALREADRLIRKFIKTSLHLNVHTPDASIHASIRDGGLGVLELRAAIPRIFLSRLVKLTEHTNDQVICTLLQSTYSVKLMGRLSKMAGEIHDSAAWRARVKSGPLTKGLEQATEDPASRAWILEKPRGWSGKDFVHAVQLRTANLPTKAIPSTPKDQRRCRGGCGVDESISHVLQTCPITHWERIRRHNEIVGKIARHCKIRGWKVEDEPHVRHRTGELFKPDLAVHQPGNLLVIADVQVSWDCTELGVSYERKRRKYDTPRFREAATNRWPGKSIAFAPVIVGARGIWPRINNERSDVLQIPASVRRSCVNTTLKWGSTIHRAFSKAVWMNTCGALASRTN
jgi:hypothetical protein